MKETVLQRLGAFHTCDSSAKGYFNKLERIPTLKRSQEAIKEIEWQVNTL
jgi:hypothetical protein